MQEVIALSVFVPVALVALKEPVRWDYACAAACMVGAVFFVFRGQHSAPSAQIAPPASISFSQRCSPAAAGRCSS